MPKEITMTRRMTEYGIRLAAKSHAIVNVRGDVYGFEKEVASYRLYFRDNCPMLRIWEMNEEEMFVVAANTASIRKYLTSAIWRGLLRSARLGLLTGFTHYIVEVYE
jgi:hypothetical protein